MFRPTRSVIGNSTGMSRVGMIDKVLKTSRVEEPGLARTIIGWDLAPRVNFPPLVYH